MASKVPVDSITFQLKDILEEWIEDHGWDRLEGAELSKNYYLEIGSELLDQSVEELRLVFFEMEE